jgi:hypothetical protein
MFFDSLLGLVSINGRHGRQGSLEEIEELAAILLAVWTETTALLVQAKEIGFHAALVPGQARSNHFLDIVYPQI